jgi:nucleotide-binding universal stress UspA family protein
MFPIKTILVVTDFSAMSEQAFRYAGALARDHGAQLIALHVVPPPITSAAVFLDESDFAAREALNTLNLPGVAIDYRVMEGRPATTIVQVACDTGCDVIVMGTHGRGGMVRMLMGSVAEEVVRKAPCAVITIKATVPVTATSDEPRHVPAGK